MVPLEVHVGGRVAEIETDVPRLRHTWPGVYFEARFGGPEVTVEVDDNENALRVIVDGKLQTTLTRPGRHRLRLDNLGDGEHTIRLEAFRETQGPTGDFIGFYVGDASAALPPPNYERVIEFIGDSNTVGYGNTSPGRECDAEDVRETTDTSLAFAPQVASHFGADYRIVASSGFGMVRNYSGGNPELSMRVLYDRALHNDPETRPRPENPADVVVIALGTNDFSTPLGEGERWTDAAALRADFHKTYVSFVEELQRRQAPKHILLVSEVRISEAVDAVAADLVERGLDHVAVIERPDLELLGCHYHLSVRDHAQMASRLIDALSSRLPPGE